MRECAGMSLELLPQPSGLRTLAEPIQMLALDDECSQSIGGRHLVFFTLVQEDSFAYADRLTNITRAAHYS